jgi:hypothetical protein
MANKSGGNSKVSQALNYKNSKSWERNRLRKLRRALKRSPDNPQILAAMSGVVYRRKTPTTPTWSASKRRTAELFKLFSGHVDLAMFSNNEKTSVPATLSHRMKWNYKAPQVNEKSMFWLGTRAHSGNGERQWA